MNYWNNTNSGFTLVEVLVAISLFSIAITGVITAASIGGANINSSKNRLIANYLAQEDIEIVRAKRDSYVLSNTTSYESGWQAFTIAVASGCPSVCDLDYNNLNDLVPSTGWGFFLDSSTTGAYNLNYNSDGFYTHGAGNSTPFNRTLTIHPVTPQGLTFPTELQITSTVAWKEGSTLKTLELNESLFDWYATH